MYEMERVSIRLVKDSPLYSDTPVNTPEDAVNLIRNEIQQYDREVICVLNLSTRGQVINMNVASIGTLNTALAQPREIFKSALLSNAASIIMFHNHPSGDPTPSPEDMDITARIYQSGALLGVNLLDHIIVGSGDEYFSFKEKGQIFSEEKENKNRVRETDPPGERDREEQTAKSEREKKNPERKRRQGGR